MEEEIRELHQNSLTISLENKKLELMLEALKLERERFLQENRELEKKIQTINSVEQIVVG